MRIFITMKIVFIIIMNPFIIFAQSNNKTAQFIENDSPRYVNEEFISLEELHTINVDEFVEYYIYKIECMETDENLNLYVVEYFEQTITVFDKDGKYIKTMGRKGQGPNEIESCGHISINNNKIYIFEHHKGVKIWDMQGKYIDYLRFKEVGNFRIFLAFDDYFLTVDRFLSERGTTYDNSIWDFILEKYSLDLQNITEIWKIKHKHEYRGLFDVSGYIAIDSKQNFYFPEKADEYKISKLTFDGKLLFTFGREYKTIPYSAKIQERRLANYARSKRKPPPKFKYPPVVRYMLVDGNDYIWVVVGACQIDSGSEFRVVSTIDIFNENGEFLYTFESPYFGPGSFIKNGRLYSMPTDDDLNIRVFKIHYN